MSETGGSELFAKGLCLYNVFIYVYILLQFVFCSLRPTVSNSQRELFLQEFNNRETIAAIGVNNDTYCLQNVPAVLLHKALGILVHNGFLISENLHTFSADEKRIRFSKVIQLISLIFGNL